VACVRGRAPMREGGPAATATRCRGMDENRSGGMDKNE
jgi:hypothetical protein